MSMKPKRRPRGRPPLPPEQRRDRVLKIRMLDDEREAVEALAHEGEPLSEAVRRVLLAAVAKRREKAPKRDRRSG